MTESTIQQKILVVDDKEENLRALEKLLRQVDAEVYSVSTGTDALRLVLRHQFAVALLDVQMPTMSGYELAQAIHTQPEIRTLPIIFLTANYKDEEQVMKGYEVGAADYLLKPIDPTVLLSKVRFFLSLDREKLEKARVLDKLEQTKAQLTEINAELSDYAYLVSHDLKAPVRGIRNVAEIIAMDHHQELSEKVSERLKTIIQLAERMSNLIHAILGLSSVEKAELLVKPVEMSVLVAEATEMLNPTGRDTIEIVQDGELPAVEGDHTRLLEVMLNLISNGLTYNNSEVKRVTISFDESKQVFAVMDNGIGIAQEFQDDIFKVCKRLNPSSEFGESTGLGLTFVQKILQRHQGSVWVESEVGRGTTFYFRLPLATMAAKRP